jgi:hypothetical protein
LGYFILSKGPNWEVVGILTIFEVIFGQNLSISTTGVTLYMANPHWLASNFE